MIITRELSVCTDCICIIANGYNGEEEETIKAFKIGEENLQKDGGYLTYGGDDLGFDWKPCDHCKRNLGGDRHSASVLANVELETSKNVNKE